MTRLTRRQFGLFASASAAALMLPTYLRAQGKPRVVVIGGGAGRRNRSALHRQGFRRRDRCDADRPVRRTYTTCFYSNLYIGGFRSLESITHSYDALQSGYGITKVTGRATGVDRAAQRR